MEFPDKEKLQELRKEGLFPISYFSISCLALLGLMLGLYLSRSEITELFSKITFPSEDGFLNFTSEYCSMFLSTIIKTSISSLLFIFAGLLIYTKFLFNLSFSSFQFDRINPFVKFDIKTWFTNLFYYFTRAFFAFLISFALFYFLSFSLIHFLKLEVGFAIKNLLKLPSSISLYLILVLIVLIVLSFIFSKLVFLFQYREKRSE